MTDSTVTVMEPSPSSKFPFALLLFTRCTGQACHSGSVCRILMAHCWLAQCSVPRACFPGIMISAHFFGLCSFSGVLAVQIFFYHHRYPNDHRLYKIMVGDMIDLGRDHLRITRSCLAGNMFLVGSHSFPCRMFPIKLRHLCFTGSLIQLGRLASPQLHGLISFASMGNWRLPQKSLRTYIARRGSSCLA